MGRGIVFSGLICDGDNKTHDCLNKSEIYAQVANSSEIARLECLSCVKRLKMNLHNRQEKLLKETRLDKRSEIRVKSKEITEGKLQTT